MQNLISRQRQQQSKHRDSSLPQTQSPKNDAARSNRPTGTKARQHKIPLLNILRKLFLLIARDLREIPSGHVVLDFIKDVGIGTLCGVVFILFLSFLDYRNIVPIRSGSRLRSAAYDLMTDPEWMKSIEDNIDVKFVDMDIYNAIKREIGRGANVTADLKKEYDNNGRKNDANMQEVENAKKEYKELLTALGVNDEKWCGGCKAGFVVCDGRVQYVNEKYGTPVAKIKISLMLEGKCIVPG